MRRIATGLLLCTLLSISVAALADSAAVPEGLSSSQAMPSVPVVAPSGSAPDPKASLDYRMNLARTAILVAGLAVFGWGTLRRVPLSPKAVGQRRIALLILAFAAYASYYNFFQFSHARGFATNDNFHYYVGSKYFDELGYFGLYECSLAALANQGLQLPDPGNQKARDLRSMELRGYNEIKKNGRDCPDRFGTERWSAFERDLVFFSQNWPLHLQRANWRDHGYHPSPAWTLVGGGLANIAPATNPRVAYLLSRAERPLIAVAFVLVAWGFGIETACLVALLWGTGSLWRYAWVGDAFFRHLWWITAMAGVVALRRGSALGGGFALAFSSLLRLFPAALGLGYALRALQNSIPDFALARRYRRFMLGAFVALGGLGVLSLANFPSSTYPDFVTKITEFFATPITNQVGLGALVRSDDPGLSWALSALRFSLVAVFCGLFWRALRSTEDWEAAAMGGCLVPILLSPTNYYYSLYVIVALLAARSPRIGLVLLSTAIAWNVNGLIYYRDYDEYTGASIIAVIASFLVAIAMSRAERSGNLDQAGPAVSSTALRSQAPMSG